VRSMSFPPIKLQLSCVCNDYGSLKKAQACERTELRRLTLKNVSLIYRLH